MLEASQALVSSVLLPHSAGKKRTIRTSVSMNDAAIPSLFNIGAIPHYPICIALRQGKELAPAGGEIVVHRLGVALRQEPVGEMAADEAASARDEDVHGFPLLIFHGFGRWKGIL